MSFLPWLDVNVRKRDATVTTLEKIANFKQLICDGTFYILKVRVCTVCFGMQVFKREDIKTKNKGSREKS